MKVLSLNCWGTYGPAERQPVLLEAVRSVGADILCLQETPPGFSKLLDYPTWFQNPETELVIASRFPAGGNLSVLYQTRSPFERFPRGAIFAELTVGAGKIWVGTTHLSWKEEDEVSRIGQTEELLKTARSLKGPVLLGGDFNASPGQAPIQRIQQDGFLDLFADLHPTDPGITWDNGNPFIQSHSVRFPDRRIDLLFLRTETPDGWVPSTCEVVCRKADGAGIRPSDHYGVLATFAS